MNDAEVIKTRRKEKRMMLIELAARAGVNQAYLAGIEVGAIHPPEEQIERILAVIENYERPVSCLPKSYLFKNYGGPDLGLSGTQF